jgi:hypothetical protein
LTVQLSEGKAGGIGSSKAVVAGDTSFAAAIRMIDDLQDPTGRFSTDVCRRQSPPPPPPPLLIQKLKIFGLSHLDQVNNSKDAILLKYAVKNIQLQFYPAAIDVAWFLGNFEVSTVSLNMKISFLYTPSVSMLIERLSG